MQVININNTTKFNIGYSRPESSHFKQLLIGKQTVYNQSIIKRYCESAVYCKATIYTKARVWKIFSPALSEYCSI